MNVTLIRPDSSAYPTTALEKLQNQPTITAIGNLNLLGRKPLALFCSIKCPGDVILGTYDLIRALRDAGVLMIGGFHSPMEKECLTLLLRGSQPVIICPARAIDGMRMPAAWKQPLAENRLLILSPFAKKHRRATADISQKRNLFVAALADQILVAHAGAGSKTEMFVHEVLSWNKPIWTLASRENDKLIASGVRELDAEDVSELTNWGKVSGERR